jgi:hypothetical protein
MAIHQFVDVNWRKASFQQIASAALVVVYVLEIAAE